MRTPCKECYECANMRTVPGNAHIKCVDPDRLVGQTADPWGVKNGWFFYPLLFDPVWKNRLCRNFKPKEQGNE